MIKVMDLFAGIGGFSLGLERTGGFETAVFCEIEEYPQKVLAKNWPGIPIHDDIRTLEGNEYGSIGLICGGYPCQPFSAAGKRGGEEDDRHLWPEMYRVIKAVRPRWVIAENVAGHISMGLDQVLSDLERANYRWWTFIIPACAMDASHRRDRIFVLSLGNSEHDGFIAPEGRGEQQEPPQPAKQEQIRESEGTSSSSGDVADPDFKGLQGHGGLRERGGELSTGQSSETIDRAGEFESKLGGMASRLSTRMDGHYWEVEPDIPRLIKKSKNRVDRLKSLGNSIVPPIATLLGYAILEMEGAENETSK